MNKTVKLAFLASLTLNVIFIGLLLAQLPRFGRSFSRQQRMERALSELPEPMRSRFRDKMKQMREDTDPLADQIRQARSEAIRILTSEPFDEAAYDRQVSRINELRAQTTQRMAKMVKEVAKESPPDQRELLAKILNRPPPSR